MPTKTGKQLAEELTQEIARREAELEILRAAALALQGRKRRGRPPRAVAKVTDGAGVAQR